MTPGAPRCSGRFCCAQHPTPVAKVQNRTRISGGTTTNLLILSPYGKALAAFSHLGGRFCPSPPPRRRTGQSDACAHSPPCAGPPLGPGRTSLALSDRPADTEPHAARPTLDNPRTGDPDRPRDEALALRIEARPASPPSSPRAAFGPDPPTGAGRRPAAERLLPPCTGLLLFLISQMAARRDLRRRGGASRGISGAPPPAPTSIRDAPAARSAAGAGAFGRDPARNHRRERSPRP